MSKEIITSALAPVAIGPYSQAVKANGVIYVSGCLGLSAGKLVEGGVAEQTRQCLANMKHVLEAAGTSMDKVVKCTVLLSSMDNFSAMNPVYAEFFSSAPPARTTFAVAGLPLNAMVEIDAICMA
jgi:2-iminobutanoate/2-iminopropanoate deaminase